MRLIFGVSARVHRLSIPEMEMFVGNGINERDANIPSGGGLKSCMIIMHDNTCATTSTRGDKGV